MSICEIKYDNDQVILYVFYSVEMRPDSSRSCFICSSQRYFLVTSISIDNGYYIESKPFQNYVYFHFTLVLRVLSRYVDTAVLGFATAYASNLYESAMFGKKKLPKKQE